MIDLKIQKPVAGAGAVVATEQFAMRVVLVVDQRVDFRLLCIANWAGSALKEESA